MMTKFNKTAFQPTLSLVTKSEGAAASFPTKKLTKKIDNLVTRLGKKALKGASKFDPIIGLDSGLLSVASSFQRHHGMHLPNVLSALLQHNGLVVLTNHKIPIFKSASSLVKANSPEALCNICVEASGDVDCHYEADLIVFCPTSGWLGVFDGKRGLGNADSSSRSTLENKLRAVHLSVRSYMRMKGYDVVSTDVRVIDFYGQTGYPADLKINGYELDAYFGIAVQNALAAFNQAMAVECAKAFHVMTPASDDKRSEVVAKPLANFRFPEADENALGDLLNDVSPYDTGLSAKRNKLAAASTKLAAQSH